MPVRPVTYKECGHLFFQVLSPGAVDLCLCIRDLCRLYMILRAINLHLSRSYFGGAGYEKAMTQMKGPGFYWVVATGRIFNNMVIDIQDRRTQRGHVK